MEMINFSSAITIVAAATDIIFHQSQLMILTVFQYHI